MQRIATSLTTTLLLCAGSIASAQAQNVTLYGLVDTGVERLDNTSTGGSITRMPSIAGSAASRWGLRGSEDLGNGLKAVFTLESGFGLDTGETQQGGRAFGRQAFVGLSGQWGTLSLGRQYSMLFPGAANTDIFLAQIYGAGAFDTYLAGPRLDNSIAYLGKFGSVTAGLLYSLGKDAQNCAGESSNSSECRSWSAVLKYDAPTWGVGTWVDEQNGRDNRPAGGADLSDKSDRRVALNGYVMLGKTKLAANYMQRRNEAAVQAQRKSTLWSLGVSHPLTTAVTLEAQYYDFDYKNSADGAQMLVLRGTYAFSRRTAAYTTVGFMRNDGKARFSPSVGASNTALAPLAGRNQTGLMVGLRHAF
ncbi:MAG: porin [Comamonas sp.]|nr:porin [Comamonas sp.]